MEESTKPQPPDMQNVLMAVLLVSALLLVIILLTT